MEIVKVSFRSALRGMVGSPGFAVAVIIILALGLGVNAITFHLVDRLILSGPSGVQDPDRVYRVVVRHRAIGGPEIADTNYSYLDYRDLLRATGLAAAAAETGGPQLVGRGSTAERIRAKLVTASYFPLLGVSPAIGRFFTSDESEREGARVVVLGHALWRRRFAGDPNVLGQVLEIGSGRYTIVGVAPRHFTGSSVARADVFLPLEAASDEEVSGDWQTSRGFGWMIAIVRLAPGVSVEAAEAEATALHRTAHEEERKQGSEGRFEFVPLDAVRGVTAPGDVSVAGLAAGVALLVLVIAVANVANLFLARSLRRSTELAVKIALGSGRGRMIAEQAVEGMLLALVGASVAALVAVQGTRFIQQRLFPNVDWLDTVIDLRGVLFVATCALVGGALAAGVPVWLTGKTDVLQWLKSAGSRVATRRTDAQVTMLIVQSALSVLLLIGAGLFVRSLSELRHLDLGVDAEQVLTVGLAPGDVPVRPDLREVPGLRERPRVESGGPYVHGVSPGYFATVGTTVIEGRGFVETDGKGAPLVAIVNQTMAKLYWPAESPLGKCLQIDDDPRCSTIVGIVENTRRDDVIEGESLLYYVPLAQAPPNIANAGQRLVVRAVDGHRGTMEGLAERIRREALALEPSLRYVGVQPLSEVITLQLRAWHLGATLFGAFGVLALLVAGVGLYGVVAFDVEGRRREIGLRSALGAPAGAILRLMMMSSVRVTGTGIVLGLAIAWLTAPFIADLLYGVSPRDASVFGAVALVLGVASVVASVAPALRAARIDPGEALRDE